MSLYTELEQDWYEPDPRRGMFRSTAILAWEIGRKGSELFYIVPIGFVFDVSIPKLFTWLLDPCDPRFMKAACLHDHMLENGWDRTTAAGVFNDALTADGVSRLKRWAMFTAVAWFKWK